MSGTDDIVAERRRQIEEEVWSAEHDDEHKAGELAKAAAAYALFAWSDRTLPPQFWPWDASWWKPKNPRRDLVRAGALIAAEIDRLDRMVGRTPPAGHKGG